MLAKLQEIGNWDQSRLLFLLFSGFTLFGILTGVALDFPFLMAMPLVVFLFFVSVVDFHKVFFLLCFCIPISIEFNVTSSLATDLPTEPLMVGLMMLYIIYALKNWQNINVSFYRHPLTLLLFLHLGWILVTAITSENIMVSVKFFLAKFWYVIVFYFLAGHILKTEKALKIFFWSILIPLFATIAIVMVRHSFVGFSFKEVNFVLGPFYRNHVTYASIIALFTPFIWLAFAWYKRGTKTWLLLAVLGFISIIAIQFSYTRAAYVAIVLAVASYYIIRFRLMKYALGLSLILVIAFFSFLSVNNKYLDFAPDYERAVTHSNFDNLLEATYKLEDISTVERFYRWIAGVYMVAEKPVMGFGPGNFINYYRSYTVTSFKTYVSENEENSGIHCYYLMTFVEQGIIGLILFVILSFYMLIKGEQVYHESRNLLLKRVVMCACLSIIIIDALLIINDMIEVDKVGSFFFICMALIVNVDLMNRGLMNSMGSTELYNNKIT